MAPILSYLTSQLALGSPLSYSEPHLGAVASESATCSKIGTSLLQKGGNAADALVATTICVGVMGMYHSGFGGGGFATIRAPNGTYFDLDFREIAPQNAFEDMYKYNANASMFGGLACAVPGELRGLEWIHSNFGKLSWKEVFMPAVQLARGGWEIGRDLHDAITQQGKGLEVERKFLHEKEWAEDFAPNGTTLGLGDWITRKRYANTLERIANEGAAVFYNGDMAENLVKAVNRAKGNMTLEDLRDYKIKLRKPATINYKGYKLTSNSAPASGVVSLAVMNIVSGYEDFGWDERVNLSTHRLDEAMRWAYGMVSLLSFFMFLKLHHLVS
jgi:gamma-glutamyltranspeptidase/glutathione hydrolase